MRPSTSIFSDWPAKHYPVLHQTMSVSNFRDDRSWDWPARAPPSPSPSSSSSASRSATPTSKNPWASSISVVLPDAESSSPRMLPCPTPPCSSPCVTPTTSRCATPVAPVAPQPLHGARPLFIAMSSPGPASPTDEKPQKRSADPTSGPTPTAAPAPTPTPNPFRDAVGQSVSLSPLSNATITPALEKQYVHRESPTLISRQGWERSTGQRAYTWALGNSKTALLFLMCDDIAAWRRASFYWLEDCKMPFQEADLEGIAADPKRVVDNQWRVMARELAQQGQHTEFGPREIVPLQQLGFVALASDGRMVDKVRWMGDDSGRVYVRKRFNCERHAEKLALLSQMQKHRALDHQNIAKIVCSYAQSATVAVVTKPAQQTLDDYMRHPTASSRPGLLLTWMNDLTQALAYIHSMEMVHQSIRPGKILCDDQKVMFSVFGVSPDLANASPRGSPRPLPPTSNRVRPLGEAAYVYAAPEVVARHAQGHHHHHRYRTSADIFSLGCVFLEMLSVAKGQTVTNLRGYRSHFNHDDSFHANLDRIASWCQLLAGLTGAPRHHTFGIAAAAADGEAATLESRMEDDAAENQVLDWVGAMLSAESSRRPKMRRLAPAMKRLDETRSVRRRRSFDTSSTGNVPPPAPTPVSAPGGSGTETTRRRWAPTADKEAVLGGLANNL